MADEEMPSITYFSIDSSSASPQQPVGGGSSLSVPRELPNEQIQGFSHSTNLPITVEGTMAQSQVPMTGQIATKGVISVPSLIIDDEEVSKLDNENYQRSSSTSGVPSDSISQSSYMSISFDVSDFQSGPQSPYGSTVTDEQYTVDDTSSQLTVVPSSPVTASLPEETRVPSRSASQDNLSSSHTKAYEGSSLDYTDKRLPFESTSSNQAASLNSQKYLSYAHAVSGNIPSTGMRRQQTLDDMPLSSNASRSSLRDQRRMLTVLDSPQMAPPTIYDSDHPLYSDTSSPKTDRTTGPDLEQDMTYQVSGQSYGTNPEFFQSLLSSSPEPTISSSPELQSSYPFLSGSGATPPNDNSNIELPVISITSSPAASSPTTPLVARQEGRTQEE
ncbi:hypothetical protein M422DRAFT_25462 [Sphaerobolus stellatus SS14]|nr:hypothetical protein M422DRAFT_25462 [Sphaerobolus stellatus SS14]